MNTWITLGVERAHTLLGTGKLGATGGLCRSQYGMSPSRRGSSRAGWECNCSSDSCTLLSLLSFYVCAKLRVSYMHCDEVPTVSGTAGTSGLPSPGQFSSTVLFRLSPRVARGPPNFRRASSLDRPKSEQGSHSEKPATSELGRSPQIIWPNHLTSRRVSPPLYFISQVRLQRFSTTQDHSAEPSSPAHPHLLASSSSWQLACFGYSLLSAQSHLILTALLSYFCLQVGKPHRAGKCHPRGLLTSVKRLTRDLTWGR